MFRLLLNVRKTILLPVFIFGFLFLPNLTQAQVATDEQLATLHSLTLRLESLQQQVNAKISLRTIPVTHTPVDDKLAKDLREGMTHPDILEIQKILATDENIYPEGIRSGYFGPLTTSALRRFQERHGLVVTGTLAEETRAAMEVLIKHEMDYGTTSVRLFSDVKVKTEFANRLRKNCAEVNPGEASFCPRLQLKYDWGYGQTAVQSYLNPATRSQVSVINAKDTIELLNQALTDRDTRSTNYKEANKLLSQAKSKLSTAEKSLRTEDYSQAESQAKSVASLAEQALELFKLRGN